jgi:hypothetical protein
VRGVAGVRDGESSGGVVVRDGEAKELGSDGVGFGVVKGRETRDRTSKSERFLYFTPKSSTKRTKSMGRDTCLKRQEVEVSWKPKDDRRETRRRLESLPNRLLEAVHRLVYSKDGVGLAEGVGLDEGKEIKAGENVRGELVGENFDVLGRVKVGAKVEVRQVNRAKESVVRDDRVKEDVDIGGRGDLSGGRTRRGKTVTTRSAANMTVYARRVAALGAGEEERSGGPLFLRHGIVVRGGGEGVVDGTEGPGSFNELNELVVASLKPLQTVGASKSGSKGEGRARGVKVEDRGRRRRDRGGGGGGEKVCGGGEN